ncbi:hypothetical protein QZH41_017103, partial [Actinostola sp. cb2023]
YDSDEELSTLLVKKKLSVSETKDKEEEQSGHDDYGFEGGDDDDGDGDDDGDESDDADDDHGDDMSDGETEGEFSAEENLEEEVSSSDGQCFLGVMLTTYYLRTRFFKAKMEMRKMDKTKGMTVNTLLVYINRFRQFAQYVVQTCDLNKEMKIVTHKLIDALPGWRESVKKTRMEQTSTRQWEERKILPSPDLIVEMKRCNFAKDCEKLLREPREDPYTLEQAVDTRNYLVFRISLENGSRAGPIHALTCHDMANSERLEGKRVLHIATHKTTAAYGGALLNLSDVLYQDIWAFIRGARLVFVKEGVPKVDNVFLGQYGNPISPSYVHRALKAFATKTLIVDEDVIEKFCSTMLRKVCVTHTRDQTTAQKSNIATLMVHSTTTAERSYSLQNRIEQSSSGHDAVRALFGSPKKTVKDDDSSTGSTNTVAPSVDTTALQEETVQSIARIQRRLMWSSNDEVMILKSASAIICGIGASTKANIIKTIN